MKERFMTFSIFEDRSRDGFSSIGDRLSRFSKTSSTKTVPNRPPANADLSIKSSALPFQIHMDSSSPSNQSIRQSSSRNPFEERTDKENHEESNCPLKKSFMIVTDQAQPIWNSNITSLPRIHPVPSAECQSLPREPLKPIRSVNLSRLEGTDYSSGPDDEAARCEIDSAMDISTFSNAMIMDEPVNDRDQVYAGEDDLDVEDVDASSDFGETRLAEYANQEMAPIYDCHEYMDDAYEHLRSIELKHVAKSNYMSKQPDITFAMRSILIDWLVEVSEEYKLQQETIYLGVNYIDRFLSVMSVQRPKLQLVGSACMFIAAKYEEIYPPEVGEFVYITDDTYSKKQVLRMEHLVLKVLGFDLAVPTPLVFLNLFGRVTDCDTETLCLAQYLSELTLMDARVYLAYRASIIGAASVALARHTQGLAAWPKHVATMSSLEVDDFKDCLVDLHATFTNASSQGQQAIREKYKSEKFHGVANLEPTPIF
ncbi:G2/mitotic-specific cyclin-A-like isoform X2 [Tigriopus californicus]|uniref:G2/mitotic-specific cyclin-A-like isoform X2 n=1 Tax=Tigriopus californicus TaxID=6832 RepID=UPI0027DA69F4|nr:G2/mitotic-specific cyclin-A-like isoform X2 [Tigriopus californicus]